MTTTHDPVLDERLRELAVAEAAQVAAWEREHGRLLRQPIERGIRCIIDGHEVALDALPEAQRPYSVVWELDTPLDASTALDERLAIHWCFLRERARARFESWLRHQPPNPKGGRPPEFQGLRVVHGRRGKPMKREDKLIVGGAVTRLVQAYRRGEVLEQTRALVMALADAPAFVDVIYIDDPVEAVKREVGATLFNRLKTALHRAAKEHGLSRT